MKQTRMVVDLFYSMAPDILLDQRLEHNSIARSRWVRDVYGE